MNYQDYINLRVNLKISIINFLSMISFIEGVIITGSHAALFFAFVFAVLLGCFLYNFYKIYKTIPKQKRKLTYLRSHLSFRKKLKKLDACKSGIDKLGYSNFLDAWNTSTYGQLIDLIHLFVDNKIVDRSHFHQKVYNSDETYALGKALNEGFMSRNQVKRKMVPLIKEYLQTDAFNYFFYNKSIEDLEILK